MKDWTYLMLTETVTLTPTDMQGLSNSDALTALFARLGYDTNARLPQSASAMGITGDDTLAKITRIERLANNDDGVSSLQVYLFEVKSVTVALTRAIVRAFRNRQGDFLLVLTDDFERLDFVLVERYTPNPALMETPPLPGLSAPRQVSVRPRVLTVDRRAPSKEAIRVLNRFSFTEGDTLAQYDKLLAAYEAAYWSERYFDNRALFSDYYLKERLPTLAVWQDTNEATARRQAIRQLRMLDMENRETRGSHSQIEAILTILGFRALRSTGARDEGVAPDYRLFASDGAVLAASAASERPSPIAICLAYPWERSLDGKDEQRDPDRPEQNPGAVVVSLLDRHEADWAIVTNGKTWRLYAAKAHSRATNYYEVDLYELLASPPEDQALAFPYFWLLFRAAAFVPQAQTTADNAGEGGLRCFLDELMDESERYARDLEEKLKTRVFDEIFPHFARGFIAYARREGQLPANLEDLAAAERSRLLEPFFTGTLTFLYRLLFVLYAESRDLLPVREQRGYAVHSLERLKQQISERAGDIGDQAPARIRRAYSASETTLYDGLQTLFRAIDRGDPDLNVPVYNGGLFVVAPEAADPSPEAAVARFLATHKIPDRDLALGLDRLARDEDEKTHSLTFIDFKSLGVRQLGSMYEGLLEFKLRVAPEPMAVVRGKKTEEIIPHAEALRDNRRIVNEGVGVDRHEKLIARGEPYLENDKRERKASGSYYTPDYIVKYIVAHTVGPVLAERLEALRPAFRAAQVALRAERQKWEAIQKQRLSVSSTPKNPEEETYLKHRGAVNEAFFDLKVLDPAMGSGHFLVEAVDYITDRMADFLTAFPWNPVVHELAKTRQEIQQEMERQGITVDASKLTDLNLLKRHVLKRCIYGVDLNPMAVELAKVSLWLDCFTLGAPLSFLDHHMKLGNSLIGASVTEVEQALTHDLWGSQFAGLLSATQLMREVGDLSDVTAQEVAASKRAYRGAYDALAPFKRLLDVWLSEYFGNKGAQKTANVYGRAIVDDDYANPTVVSNAVDRAAIETALTLSASKRFFHWELEFPEVFYDATKRKENGGFDAVVGNPPYVNMVESAKSDDEYQKSYFKSGFASASGGFDMYVLFQEQALRLVRLGTYTGLIVPNKVLSAEYAIELRKWMLSNSHIIRIVDYSGVKVFDASVYPLIVICMHEVGSDEYKTCVEKGIAESINTELLSNVSSHLLAESPDCIWSFLLTASIQVFVKALSLGLTLENLATVKGAATVSEAYEFKNSIYELRSLPYNINSSRYVPFVVSGTLGRYDNRWLTEEVQYIKDQYIQPVIDLDSNEVSVVRREQIRSSKIIMSGMSKRPVGFLDLEGVAGGKSTVLVYNSQFELGYVISLINSNLMAHVYSVLFETLALSGGFLRFGPPQIARLPIRRIAFTTPEAERVRLVTEGKQLYERYIAEEADETGVLDFVTQRLTQEPEQSDVVHDLLASLAEEMIRLNAEKRAAQRHYLDALVATLKILPDKAGNTGLETLTGKGKLTDYPGDYQKGEEPLSFEELLDILRKNKGRLGASLSDTALIERLRAGYEASLARVLPLKTRLTRTDKLIDQIVYRLYGLIDDEIALVEGR